ncbi:MAG TPA: PQQ-binding-like beta-propeller repeat protein [Candidatus Dormibacteraeota bacterium]|nr:PQQ-binding-like beta-propeller repeat protein [Candidatus Dormibacteraeota bacterium]
MDRASILMLAASAIVAGCGTSATSSTSTSPPSPTPVSVPTPTPRPPLPSLEPFVRSDTEWTTYMGDRARAGIGPAGPLATNPHRTWTAQVDGDVYAEPLVAGGSVIVATEQDSVYALDPDSGAVRWRRHLGEPVPVGELACGNIAFNGITSTPVVDPAAGIVYAVAMFDSPMRHELFAVRLSDGGIVWSRGVDPPGAEPRIHQQRGSLNLAHGLVYMSYGGFSGDCGRYNGWVVGAPVSGTGPLYTWEVGSTVGGAVWAPPGPVISSAGDVWVTTGNTNAGQGATQGTYDDANGVFHLDAALASAVDGWAPQNWAALNRDDVDLGSVAPALLPGGLVFAVGKEGVGYLLRDSHLGGIGGEVFKDMACRHGGPEGGAFGGVAVVGSTLLVPCKDGLAALHVDSSAPSFSVAWRSASSANSPLLAYGLIWTVVVEGLNGHTEAWSGALVGLDPATGATRVQLHLGGIPHYPSPAAAGGHLYIAGLGSVYAVSAV